ncbi:VOC family protein, partial [Rhizobium johnstonii]|uniref:VOC family protein n=1 Tax=Rhizobium johnstonii TaxID=3019933 RepID=UPI003F94938D
MPLKRLVIYAGNVEETSRFYEKHFGFKATSLMGDRIVELVSQDGGANIMLHRAAKGQRSGQSTSKTSLTVD